jgi:hypothetical protein
MFSPPLRMARGADAIGAERNTGPRPAEDCCDRLRRGLLAGADCGFVRQLGDVSERKSIARFDRLFPGLRVHRKGRRHL